VTHVCKNSGIRKLAETPGQNSRRNRAQGAPAPASRCVRGLGRNPSEPSSLLSATFRHNDHDRHQHDYQHHDDRHRSPSQAPRLTEVRPRTPDGRGLLGALCRLASLPWDYAGRAFRVPSLRDYSLVRPPWQRSIRIEAPTSPQATCFARTLIAANQSRALHNYIRDDDHKRAKGIC
jgi:hypothetical protein